MLPVTDFKDTRIPETLILLLRAPLLSKRCAMRKNLPDLNRVAGHSVRFGDFSGDRREMIRVPNEWIELKKSKMPVKKARR